MALLAEQRSDVAFRLQRFLDSSFTKELILLNTQLSQLHLKVPRDRKACSAFRV